MPSNKVPIHERAFSVGDITGVNAYRIKLDALKQRLREGGYHIRETPHFLVCQRPGNPTLLVHWFPQVAIDGNLGHYLMEELQPLGMLANLRRYGDIFGAIVGSIFPRDNERAWRLFATNTLQRYHRLLAPELEIEAPAPDCTYPIEVFAALYRRVHDLCAGASLLDAGCSSGFLPLIIAERLPALAKVVGIDIRAEPFSVARAIAGELRLANVEFIQADLLSHEIASFRPFDTVTLLHVLEHFSETEMYRVLANLLGITTRRLVIAVPYEEGEPEAAYGHKQLFTREKLEAVGRWCIAQWGSGQMHYEDCAGGLIWLDRFS